MKRKNHELTLGLDLSMMDIGSDCPAKVEYTSYFLPLEEESKNDIENWN